MPIIFSSLASGSSGNCQLIKSKDTTLLLDAGLTGKYIKTALSHYDVSLSDIDGIVVTHEHIDHIKGLGILHRKADIPIYITPKTWQASRQKLGKIDEARLHFIDGQHPFQIKDIIVAPQRVSHDAADPLCYSFSDDKDKIAVVTDLGTTTPSLIAHIKDASLIMIESNHNVEMLMMGSYPYPLKKRVASEWGHLSNESCAQAAIAAIESGNVSTVLLAHLSHENNTPELAYQSVSASFTEAGIQVGRDIMLELTYRKRTGNLYMIDR